MSTLFTLPRQFTVDGSGSPRAGAKLFFYEAGTLTSQNTYSDNDLSVANTNPVVADSAGVFGPIYLSNANYRVILKDSADAQLWDQDNINAPLLGLFGSTVITKNGNYTVTEDDKGKVIKVTATATITLVAVATAAAGFTLLIQNTGTGTVTIDPDSTEQINGAASVELRPDEWALVVGDGTEWMAATAVQQTTGTFTANWSGFTTSPTTTVTYRKVGDIVSLFFAGQVSATSNSTLFQSDVGDMPESLRPSAIKQVLVPIVDNGTAAVGNMWIQTDGRIRLYSGLSNDAFTASGTKGLQAGRAVTYLID